MHITRHLYYNCKFISRWYTSHKCGYHCPDRFPALDGAMPSACAVLTTNLDKIVLDNHDFEYVFIVQPFQSFICIWWRHQIKTFPALLAICAGNSPVTGEFPTQRPVTQSFDGFYDLRLNKQLSKQPWGWWFETPSRSLWRYIGMIGILFFILININFIEIHEILGPRLGLNMFGNRDKR